VLECRNGVEPTQEYGTSADSLECGMHGHLTIHYANGRSRPVRGAFLPERRPFTGLTHIIPASAGQMLEGNPRWAEIMDERSAALGKGTTGNKGRNVSTRGSMRSSAQLTTLSTEGESRPHTRGTELSATFADEVCWGGSGGGSICLHVQKPFLITASDKRSECTTDVHERHCDRIRRGEPGQLQSTVSQPENPTLGPNVVFFRLKWGHSERQR